MTSELNRTVSENTVNGLELALASTAVATAKAQNFHWNVTGMAFAPLHALFEEIYAEHFEAQDTFAERIRMLGRTVDGRQSEHLKKSIIAETDGAKKFEKMLLELALDQERLSALLLQLASVAEEEGDPVTNGLAVDRAHIHDTFAWKLRAHMADALIYHGGEAVLRKTITEITRLLKPGGIYQGTMLSKRRFDYGVGNEISRNT